MNHRLDDDAGHAVSSSPSLPVSPRLRRLAAQAWRTTLDLLFPPRCVSCGRHGAWFCSRCQGQVQPIVPPVCTRCGRMPGGSAVCEACRHGAPALNGLRAAALFEGPLRKAIHSFKYNCVRDLAGPLGEILAEGYSRFAVPADLLVPVPLHRARQGQRGFNQSQLLAEELAARAGLAVASRSLMRVRNTQSQVGLGAAQRRDNVRGAFAWRGETLRGRSVLLIDDVCTTGATMEACAAALYEANAAAVWGLTLARER